LSFICIPNGLEPTTSRIFQIKAPIAILTLGSNCIHKKKHFCASTQTFPNGFTKTLLYKKSSDMPLTDYRLMSKPFRWAYPMLTSGWKRWKSGVKVHLRIYSPG